MTVTPAPADLAPGRPVVLRGGTVLVMDDARTVLHDADVLVVDGAVAAVGPGLTAPDDALEIDAAGGIVMPGMVDTHRHMWQTAMRGYGADWTLTQYFVWYYLEHGRAFRPQDVAAGNVLSALESLDAGVTTTVDWSHGLQSVEHAEAAVDALRSVPGRFVLAYGNIQAGPWEWSASADFRSFVERFPRSDMLGLQMAFDVTGDPAFPERARLRGRPRARPGRDHARRGVGRDQRRRHPAHARRRVHGGAHGLRPRRDAEPRQLPPDRRDRRLGVGGHGVRAELRAGLPAHLAAARARHPGVDLHGHERVDVRRPVLGHAQHRRRRPLARAHGGAQGRRDDHPRPPARRGGRRLGHPRRRQGPRHGRDGRQPRGRQARRRRAHQERPVAGDVPRPQPVRPRGPAGPARPTSTPSSSTAGS